MKLEELIQTEDFAVAISDQIPTFDEFCSSRIGTIEGKDVYGSKCWSNVDSIGFLDENQKVIAFISYEPEQDENGYYPLVRAWSDSKHRGKGLITALLAFLTTKMGNHLIITKFEHMTKEGLDWIIKLIKNPSGFEIHYPSGLEIDPEELKREWENAKKSKKAGALEIIIENLREYPLIEPMYGEALRYTCVNYLE